MKYKIGDTVTWKSLGTGKVRVGYISNYREHKGSPKNNIKDWTTYSVKNKWGDEWTVSEEEIIK